MFGARSSWLTVSKRVRSVQRRRYCNPTTSSNNSGNTTNNNKSMKANDSIRDLEAYRDLDKLDFMKAAKILFSHPPKKKTFGLDFHLVQLFFALMPSLAVYLVAQYARHEMKKMDAELELKKKTEEEVKAKEMETIAAEEKAKGFEFLQVKERLEALEETVKEIVVDKKKQTSDEKSKNAQQIEDAKGRSVDSDAAAATRQPINQGSSKQQRQEDEKK